LKASLDEYYLEDDRDYKFSLKYKISLLDKIKNWRVRISRLDEIVFSNTSIVEKEELYIIDYEGYQREILKI